MRSRAQMPLVGGLIAFTLIGLVGSDAQALRCGTRLVSQGDTRAQVVAICGQPDDVSSYVVQRSSGAFHGDLFAFTRRGYVVRSGWNGPQVVMSVQVDEWLFNFGSRNLMQRVVFENGRVERIESLGYGWDTYRAAPPTAVLNRPRPVARPTPAPRHGDVPSQAEREVEVEAGPAWR